MFPLLVHSTSIDRYRHKIGKFANLVWMPALTNNIRRYPNP
jgi:hypothetical protein